MAVSYNVSRFLRAKTNFEVVTLFSEPTAPNHVGHGSFNPGGSSYSTTWNLSEALIPEIALWFSTHHKYPYI